MKGPGVEEHQAGYPAPHPQPVSPRGPPHLQMAAAPASAPSLHLARRDAGGRVGLGYGAIIGDDLCMSRPKTAIMTTDTAVSNATQQGKSGTLLGKPGAVSCPVWRAGAGPGSLQTQSSRTRSGTAAARYCPAPRGESCITSVLMWSHVCTHPKKTPSAERSQVKCSLQTVCPPYSQKDSLDKHINEVTVGASGKL